ncbi:MAG: c-type cytochrome biogenesis protein CcsB [Bacillota bacterium]|nr:c-type cytochrome biogenesis protein CcsB [Bacillota bacterium]
MTLVQIEDKLFLFAVFIYALSMVLYFLSYINKNEKIAKKAQVALRLSFLIHTAAIIVRGLAAARMPLSNQYEFATAFAWGVALFLIIFENKYKYYSMGSFVLPLLLIVIGYAALANKEIQPLMPALKSWWLLIHVSLAILAYGSFALATGTSIMFLIQNKKDGPDSRLPGKEDLDQITYRAVVLGFLFLSMTIITGALWAKKSWGRYWAWDPKETWSLVTWIIYTIYLHLRRSKGLADQKSAWFCILGFLAVLFTYVGVNTLLPSLHSYV